jgi:hypothetical protein
MITFPPLPPVVDSVPAVRFTFPPVPPVPDSAPAVKFNAPPVPTEALLVAGWSEREFPPVNVVMSGFTPPTKASCPVGLTVNSLVPLFCTSSALAFAALVLLMINAGAVPALVRVNEVEVESPDAKVKAMLDPLVVVMVLPPLYAVWREKVEPEHSTTSLELLRQRAVPDDVVNPVKSK